MLFCVYCWEYILFWKIDFCIFNVLLFLKNKFKMLYGFDLNVILLILIIVLEIFSIFKGLIVIWSLVFFCVIWLFLKMVLLMFSFIWVGFFECVIILKLLLRKLYFEIEMWKGWVFDGFFGNKFSIMSGYLNEVKMIFISLIENWGFIYKVLWFGIVVYLLEKILFFINMFFLVWVFRVWILIV